MSNCFGLLKKDTETDAVKGCLFHRILLILDSQKVNWEYLTVYTLIHTKHNTTFEIACSLCHKYSAKFKLCTK